MSNVSLSVLSLSSRLRPMPVPSAMISVRISSLVSILSKRAFSTLRILPFSGRMAWNLRSRPCFAEPPAESPSTMYSSLSAGSFSEQSASLPGKRTAVQGAFAPDQVFRLPRGLAGTRRIDRFADDLSRNRRVLFEVGARGFIDGGLDDALHFAVARVWPWSVLRTADCGP